MVNLREQTESLQPPQLIAGNGNATGVRSPVARKFLDRLTPSRAAGQAVKRFGVDSRIVPLVKPGLSTKGMQNGRTISGDLPQAR